MLKHPSDSLHIGLRYTKTHHGPSVRFGKYSKANAFASERSSKVGKPEVVKQHDAWQNPVES